MANVTPPTSYIVRQELTSPLFGKAFAHGCGGGFTTRNALEPGSVAMFGSVARWMVLKAAQDQGRDWYYGDHGYLGRGEYYRVTKNAYQFTGPVAASNDRFRKFSLKVKPWRRAGSHVLVCPQSPGFMELHGLNTDAWVDDVRARIARVSDRPVKVRWKTEFWSRPIAHDLQDAWAVVVFSSGAAIDALLAGVPVFVTAPWAAAARMGSTNLAQIETPVYPDNREAWLWTLAEHQFTLNEIREGMAWEVVQ